MENRLEISEEYRRIGSEKKLTAVAVKVVTEKQQICPKTSLKPPEYTAMVLVRSQTLKVLVSSQSGLGHDLSDKLPVYNSWLVYACVKLVLPPCSSEAASKVTTLVIYW